MYTYVTHLCLMRVDATPRHSVDAANMCLNPLLLSVDVDHTFFVIPGIHENILQCHTHGSMRRKASISAGKRIKVTNVPVVWQRQKIRRE